MFGGHYEWLGTKVVMSFDFVLSCLVRLGGLGLGLGWLALTGQGRAAASVGTVAHWA